MGLVGATNGGYWWRATPWSGQRADRGCSAGDQPCSPWCRPSLRR